MIMCIYYSVITCTYMYVHLYVQWYQYLLCYCKTSTCTCTCIAFSFCSRIIFPILMGHICSNYNACTLKDLYATS